jgi:hypothetical protein
MTLIRPQGKQFSHEFIVHVVYHCDHERYTFMYRISRQLDHIKQFVFYYQQWTDIVRDDQSRSCKQQNHQKDFSYLWPSKSGIQHLEKWSLSKIRNRIVPEYALFITSFLKNRKTDPPLDHSVHLTGCITLTTLRCLDPLHPKYQYLFLLGEDHESLGNFPECFTKILKTTQCPIDIIFESSYDLASALSQRGQVFSMDYYDEKKKSNLRQFRQRFEVLCRRGRVPPQTQQHFHKPQHAQYVQKCVVPYQGRVKIWAEEYRYTDQFLFLQMLQLPSATEEEHTMKFEFMMQFFTLFCDAALFLSDFDMYTSRLLRFLKEVETYIRSLYPDIRFSLGHQQGHGVRRLLKHMQQYLPEKVITLWLDIIYKQCDNQKFHMSALFDLPACVRILRLYQERKDRLVFVLCGAAHTASLVALLTKMNVGDLTIQRIHQQSCPTPRFFYPALHSSDRTTRMRYYDRKHQKK